MIKDPHVVMPPAPSLKVSCCKDGVSPGPPGGTELCRGQPSPCPHGVGCVVSEQRRDMEASPGRPCLEAGSTSWGHSCPFIAPLKTRSLALWVLSLTTEPFLLRGGSKAWVGAGRRTASPALGQHVA